MVTQLVAQSFDLLLGRQVGLGLFAGHRAFLHPRPCTLCAWNL